MTRHPKGSAAHPFAKRTERSSGGRRPRRQRALAHDLLEDALALPDELRKASGLSVHTLRRLRPHPRSGTYADPKTGQIYSARLNPIGGVCADGYVRIGKTRGAQEQYAHRIVWEAVNGPIPTGKQVDHKNHRRSDNRARNLPVLTPSQNIKRAINRREPGWANAMGIARLTEAIVAAIRAAAGERSDQSWAAALGVDRSTVRDARVGNTWRHVKPCPRMRIRQRPRSP